MPAGRAFPDRGVRDDFGHRAFGALRWHWGHAGMVNCCEAVARGVSGQSAKVKPEPGLGPGLGLVTR
jgi:uncharacterized protein YycO